MKQKMLDEQCFVAFLNGQTLCLKKQISNVSQTMFGRLARALLGDFIELCSSVETSFALW